MPLNNNIFNAGLGALALFMPCTQIYAFEIVKDFYLPSTVQYDDNVNMSSSDSAGAFRYILNPRLNLSLINDINSINLDASLNIIRSNVDEQLILDREDPSVNFKWARQYDRGGFSIGSNYTRNSTRVTEFDETGVVFGDGNSVNKSVFGSISYEITDRLNTTLNLRSSKQTFSQSTLSDFKDSSANLRFSYQYNEKTAPFIEFGYTKFTNQEDVGSVSTNNKLKRASVGFSYEYSPVSNLSVSIGANDNSANDSVGWIANSSFNYEINETIYFSAGYNRLNSSSGLGGVQESDNINISINKSISDFDEVGSIFNWSKNNNLNTVTSKQLSVFYQHTLSLNWSTRLDFSYRNIKFDNNNATGAQLGFTLSYNLQNF